MNAGAGSGSGEPEPVLLERITNLTPGPRCEFGGQIVQKGLDNGDRAGVAHDAILQDGEVDSEQVICRAMPDPAKVVPHAYTSAPNNTTCKPPLGPSLLAGVTYRPAFTKLNVPQVTDNDGGKCQLNINDSNCTNAHRPTAMLQHPVSKSWYLVEQAGRILRFADDENTTAVDVVLDIRSKVMSGFEPGMLNLDFDPNNPDYAYVYYNTCASQSTTVGGFTCSDGNAVANIYTTVARFHLDGSGSFETQSERIIVEQQRPLSEHNGGGARFGPDGFLYVAMGDGGDLTQAAFAQNLSSLLGKVLRLAVNNSLGQPFQGSDPPYAIPPTNPFYTDVSSRGEIYALGFRNPWRFDFDSDALFANTPRLWVGDVGLITAEEIDYVEPGKNYGWPHMEGTFCRPATPTYTVLDPANCNPMAEWTPPAYSYRQAMGVSVTGGFVYQGSAIPSLQGWFVFADFSLGTLHAIRRTGGTYERKWLFDANTLVPAFGRSATGELFFVSWWEGDIYKLVPVDSSQSMPPSKLSQTGCVDPSSPKNPAAGGIPYNLNVPFFSEEGVYKSRWMYLPAGTKLTEYDTTGSLIFQPGSVIVKNFDIGSRRIETRLLYRHADGEWSGWSYEWLEDQSDALLVRHHKDVTIGSVNWSYPDNGECIHCHTYPAGRVLGPHIEQLNRLTYFPDRDVWANWIESMKHVDLIDRYSLGANTIVALPDASQLPALPRVDDESKPIGDRVRAYLYSNCSYCHRPAGGGRGDFSLLYQDVFAPGKGICNRPPSTGTYDIANAKVVTPGSLDRSVLYRRLSETTLPYRMHPYRSSVDSAGVALIRKWLETTAATDCP